MINNTSVPPAGDDAAPSAPSARQKAEALLRQATAETKEAARQTGQQLERVYHFGREYWQQVTHQRQTREILTRLGQRLFEVGLGDPALRQQFEQLNERILNLQAAKSSTRKLETERRGLQIRLAESVLNGPAPPQVADEFAQAAEANEAQRHRRERLDQQRATLLPPDRPSRLRIAAGLGVIGLLTVILLVLVAPYIGFGPSLGPRGSELLGTWTGTYQMSMFGMKLKTGYSVQFRRNGRVQWEEKLLEDTSGWTEAAKKMMGDTSETTLGSGRWRVDHVEGNVFAVRVINDLEPDESKAVGWRVTLDNPKEMTLVNFIDVPLKLKR